MPSGVTADPRKAAERGKTALGTSSYLAHQAEDAKAAIAAALAGAKGEFAKGLDPKGWTRQHPWVALGASAVAGFVATATLVPSKEEQALKKLAKNEQALNPPPPPPQPAAAPAGSGEHGYKAGQHGFAKALLGEVIGAIKPALISLLTAGATAATTKPSQEERAAAAAAGQQQAAAGGPM